MTPEQEDRGEVHYEQLLDSSDSQSKRQSAVERGPGRKGKSIRFSKIDIDCRENDIQIPVKMLLPFEKPIVN